MRTFAKLHAVNAEGSLAFFEATKQIIIDWAEKKFRNDDNKFVIARDGRAASFSQESDRVENLFRFRVKSQEPISGGILELLIDLISDLKFTYLFCRIGVSVERVAIDLPQVSIRPPRFIKDIFSNGGWTIDINAEPIFTSAHVVQNKDVDIFIDFLLSDNRRLPMCVVSETDDYRLGSETTNNLSRQLCGLANTFVINADTSWILTERFGRKLSCFSGGVRLYWPSFSAASDPFMHPLFTYDRICDSCSIDQVSASSWLIQRVLPRLLEASCFLKEDIVFFQFDQIKSKIAFDKKLDQAKISQDANQIVELYYQENKLLLEKIEQLTAENQSLQDNFKAILDFRANEKITRTGSRDEIHEPESIHEAVKMAKKWYSEKLMFPDDLDRQISRAHQDAGPPDKILRFLGILAELSQLYEIKKGAIGCDVVQWLKAKNVEASGESETKQSHLYEFQVGGVQRKFELHLKPNEGTSPDRCVRIYFLCEKETPCVKIGFIGCKASLE